MADWQVISASMGSWQPGQTLASLTQGCTAKAKAVSRLAELRAHVRKQQHTVLVSLAKSLTSAKVFTVIHFKFKMLQVCNVLQRVSFRHSVIPLEEMHQSPAPDPKAMPVHMGQKELKDHPILSVTLPRKN